MKGESVAVDSSASGGRLLWVDAMKGVGIIAVIAGHVWTRGAVRDAIYSVHMPLFFILSGYVAQPRPTGQLTRRLLLALIVPFLSFSLVLLGADFLIEGLRGMRPVFASFGAGLHVILFATEQTRGPFTILWFVPCLFLARLIWNALLLHRGRADDRMMLFIVVLLFALALGISQFGGPSPLGVIAVPSAVLLLWAGRLWRLRGQPGPVLTVGAMLLLPAVLFLVPPPDMKAGDLGDWPGLALAGAVVATFAFSVMVRQLPPLAMHALAAIGRRALAIMFAHVAFIHYLAPYWGRPALFAAAFAGALLIAEAARHIAPLRLCLLGDSQPLRKRHSAARLSEPTPSP